MTADPEWELKKGRALAGVAESPTFKEGVPW